MIIHLRTHHLLCNYCFIGNGYSSKFINNFNAIHDFLNKHPNTNINIKNSLDSVCNNCPSNKVIICATESKVQMLDKLHAEALGIKGLKNITWNDAKLKIIKNINLDKFNNICSTCQWFSTGICKQVLFKNN